MIAVLTNKEITYVETITFTLCAIIGGLFIAKFIYSYVQKKKK